MTRPLAETINQTPLGWPGRKPLDMKTRGPKILLDIARTWTAEHREVAKKFAEAREAARKQYGRS